VLDVGCGSGRHTAEVCRWNCRSVSVDVSVQELKKARQLLANKRLKREVVGHGDFIAASAEHLPFKDGVFDRIVCTEVLEHIPDDRAGIRELVRVLKPGGLIAVSVPNYLPEVLLWTISWGYWRAPGGHIRIYKPGEMAQMLSEGGLELYAQRLRHAIQTVYWFIRCSFGYHNESFLITRNFQRLVQWHYRRRVRLLEYLEAFTNFAFGKDLILYGKKPPCSSA